MFPAEWAQGYREVLGNVLRRFWPWLATVLAASAILALITWRRTHAFGLTRREQVGWSVFVLLFGVPAWVGFLLHRRWPVRIPCPNCHARPPRDRELLRDVRDTLSGPGSHRNRDLRVM